MEHGTWTIVKREHTEAALESANSVFTVSNGYMALKGKLLEDRSGSYPSTFIAAVFDRVDHFAIVRPVSYERRHFDPKYFDDAGLSPSIANLPNPLFVRVFIDNRELSFRRGTVTGFQQMYQLREGLYSYQYDLRDAQGRTTRIRTERFCDMCHPHRAHMLYSITPLDYSAVIRIQSGIDGTIRSNFKWDKQFRVVGAEALDGNRCTQHVRTFLKEQDVYVATATVFREMAAADGAPLVEDEVVSHTFEVNARQGQPIALEKHMVLASSEDARHGVACHVEEELRLGTTLGYDQARADNAEWWRDAWEQADVHIEGDDLAQTYLRFCLMHLISAAPTHSDKLSVPCKLLTGEWYQGTVFYDTDLYIEPFYLFTFPELARACLNYRHVCLGPGREIAKRLEYGGAKLAWQAGPYGEEELGYWWRYTVTNIHINADVAYSLMQYWYATRDVEFMADRGIEMLVDFSRFYVSRATKDEDGRYHLGMVAGPDEGHCESTDNFYTNILAKKTLTWTVQMLDMLRCEDTRCYEEVVARLDLHAHEPASWQEMADGLVLLYDNDTRVYEQYDGFYALKPVPGNLLANRKEWWTPVFPYQAIHQPDVVMALVLLRDEFPADVLKANFDYYLPRTMSFSSMSFAINALAGRLTGDIDYAYEQFLISAGEDLDESLTERHDVKDGIHGTASGGAWLAAVSGFGGVFLSQRGLAVDPKLPRHWQALGFKIVVLGETLTVEVTQSHVRIEVGSRAQVEIEAIVAGTPARLVSGQSYEFPLPPAGS
jgi:kojibiose phosphorylase